MIRRICFGTVFFYLGQITTETAVGFSDVLEIMLKFQRIYAISGIRKAKEEKWQAANLMQKFLKNLSFCAGIENQCRSEKQIKKVKMTLKKHC